MANIAIIGGCGRLGFRLSLLASNNGHNVTSIDFDEERINEIQHSCLPFVEDGAEIYLEQALKNKNLSLSTDYAEVNKADIVIITIGTPVDSNLNPSLEPVAGVIFDLSDYFKQNQLIVFRNTISPSVVGRIKTLLEDTTGFKIGKDIFLAFAPELNSESINIHDLAKANQPIGAYDEKSYRVAEDFFKTITKGKLLWLSPEEALLSKLMTNMFNYIQTAAANEFYLIAESFGANIYRILDATRYETASNHWANIPNPNPNGAGPGMHKEGWFLVDRIPFSELITNSFKLNESIPAQIVQKLDNHNLSKVAILGMTNKADSDDARASLSYKLRKALYYKDYVVVSYDPNLPEFSDSSVLKDADAVILMTGHKEFNDLEKIKQLVGNQNCFFVDIGGFWKETTEIGINGVFKLKELQAKNNQK